MTPAGSRTAACPWLIFLSVAIAAVLAVVLPAASASAAAASASETRVGAHNPVMILGAGPSHQVLAVQGRRGPVPAAWVCVGCVCCKSSSSPSGHGNWLADLIACITATGGWDLESLAQSGQRLVGNEGMTKAGASLVQYAEELGYDQIGGSVATKNALGQDLLEEILTNPGTKEVKVTSGNFAGGVRFISPTYAGATFNPSGVFQYFGCYGP